MLVNSVASRKQLGFQARLSNFQTFKLDDDVALDGRLFHTFAAMHDRESKTTDDSRRTRGIMSSAVDAERSR